LIHQDDVDSYLSDYLASVSQQRPFHNRSRMRRHDGAWRWAENFAHPLFDEQSTYLGHVGVAMDITAAVKTECALHEAEERLRILVDAVPQLVWRSVDQGRWTWSSPRWQAFIGQSPQESLGLGWLDAIHPDDRGPTMEAWREARSDNAMEIEHRVRRAKDGAFVWHDTRSTPLLDANERQIEWIGITTEFHRNIDR
jgi:PAS domain S-box-containing protein